MFSYSANTTLTELLGRVDNLSDPTPIWNQKATIFGVTLAFQIVSCICIVLRLYTRVFIVKAPGWDDLFVCIFMGTGIIISIMLCILPNYGLGQHFILLTEDMMASYLTRFYIATAVYAMATTSIKISLLLQYLRIFEKGPFRKFTIGMIVIISLWGFAYTFIAWFPCFPVHAFWNILTSEGTCYGFGSRLAVSFFATWESHAGMNMIFDIIVMAIPIPLYFQRGVTRKTQQGLLTILIMGIFISSIAIWRLATIIEHRAATYPTFDPTWYAPKALILAIIEVHSASICASATVFYPVLAAKYDNIFITNEITITRSHRRLTDGGFGDREDIEMQRRFSMAKESINGRAESHNRGGSEVSLTKGGSGGIQKSKYVDTYTLEQVDPLRSAKGRVETRITVGQVGGGDTINPLSRSESIKLTKFYD